MSATLGEPVLLTTYATPSSSKKGKGKEVAVDERPFVFASFSSVAKRENEQVTLAVQGDGIHVFELGDLHPVSSRTLGPSTSFASAPAAVICTEDGKSVRRTYVVILSAADLKKEDTSRTIWSWKELASGDIGSSQDKQTAKLPYDIAYLLAPQELNSIIAVSSSGDFTLMDLDLSMKNTWSPKNATQKVLKVFLFPERDCKFIPQATPPSRCVMLMFVERDEKLHLQIGVFASQGEMTVLDPLDVPLRDAEDVLDISCDASGSMSVLGLNGAWSFFTINLKNGSTKISPGSASLRLKSLSFISEKQRSTSSRVSLLSLGSSFVLLAGTTSKEIALLLWDIQYGVLLHSTKLPVPGSLETSAQGQSVQLCKGNSSQALLVLSPCSPSSKRDSKPRSSVLLVPFSVPERSTIAGAMGKAAASEPWLASDTLELAQQDEDVHGKEAMLVKLQEAIENRRIKDAEDIFFNWIKEHDEKAKNLGQTSSTDRGGDGDVEMTEVEVQKPKDVKKPPPLKSLLNHAFVVRILATILRPDESPSENYSPKICRYLVTKYLASNSMVNEGLLGALVQRNDWETIRECFLHVVDLPENELLRLLHVIVKHHRDQSSRDKDAIVAVKPSKKKPRADEHWNGMPSVSTFLMRVMDYPASQAAWRTALRVYFADVDDLMILLPIADEWLDAFTRKDIPLGLGEVTVNEHGVPVPEQVDTKRPSRTKGPPMPSLENLLAFLQAILDSSFVSLLQNSASHPLLQRIAENISQIQAETIELQSLRGPLDPFARAQSKAVLEASGGGKKREEVDWRKRRKQAHEQAAISLGPYQVEELVF